VLILIVAGGPDKGQIHELFDGKQVFLGREGADLQFSDPKVSRRHARMWSNGGRWYIQDLDSRHGTHRNHKPIDDTQPLKDGDYLQIGRTVMVLARMSAVNAVNAERAALTEELIASHAGGSRVIAGLPIKPKSLVAGTAAAAVLLIGLNVASLMNASRGVGQLEQQIVALSEETPQQQELRREIRLAVQAKQGHEAKLETMFASLSRRDGVMLPKLETILATLDAQPDVAGPLTALAQAIEGRDDGEQLNTKVDAALALLKERGGDAEALAVQFRQMLADQPTVAQLAAATTQRNDQTVMVLQNILGKLDTVLPSQGSPAGRSVLTDELAELRRLIETRPSAADEQARQLKPLLEKVLARVENLSPNDGTQTLLAAIAEVKSALPPDNSAALIAVLAHFDGQPTTVDLANVNRQLASLANELRDRKDAQLIQQQLAQLIEASQGQPNADAALALAATSDPLLGQILSQVQALAESDRKLDAIYQTLKQQPYDNRAMLDEVLAQLEGHATENLVAAMLDQTMAELRGKSITDADQLRRLIQREVVAAVGKANGERVDRRRADTRLTRTETAYKLAFESGKKITIGVTLDPTTGGYSKGRTLDPAAAQAAGHRSWRDWYLMDDLANRMQIEQSATRFARRQSRTTTLSVPPAEVNASGTNINAIPARD